MKICVLVKEVPDAAVQKRIDPSTGRMDRSGEKNLNPYDTHAIEAAMQIKEGGAVEVEEVVAVTMGPETAVRALHKAVSLGADRSVHLSDDAARRLRRRRHRLRAGQDARAREPRPRPARPAVRRRRVLHDRRRRGRAPADAVADAGHQDGRRRTASCAASARPSTATTPSRSSCPPSSRSATRSTSRATRRSRRSWAPRRSRSTRSAIGDVGIDADRSASDGSQVAVRRLQGPARRRPPARSSRTRTPTRRSRRSSPGSTRGS